MSFIFTTLYLDYMKQKSLKMKKKLVLKLLLFLTINVSSQCLENIKRQNTFFILFEDKSELTSYWCTDKLPLNLKACRYYFYKSNKKEFKYQFDYREYPDADKMHNDIDKNMVFRIDKSFLRKNKDIIITREFMEKIGLETMLDLLYADRGNKTIFLINTADKKEGKILLREVTIDYVARE